MKKRSVTADLLLGAVAGAGATWLMDRLTTALLERSSEITRKREERARGELSAVERAAETLFRVRGEKRKQAGVAIHWGLGVFGGMAYAGLRHAFPKLRYGSGLAYGAAFWLAMDEGANALFRFSPPPSKFPWQTHARGLAGHLALGAAIEAAFDVADLAA